VCPPKTPGCGPAFEIGAVAEQGVEFIEIAFTGSMDFSSRASLRTRPLHNGRTPETDGSSAATSAPLAVKLARKTVARSGA
jgi:hypothetical protein